MQIQNQQFLLCCYEEIRSLLSNLDELRFSQLNNRAPRRYLWWLFTLYTHQNIFPFEVSTLDRHHCKVLWWYSNSYCLWKPQSIWAHWGDLAFWVRQFRRKEVPRVFCSSGTQALRFLWQQFHLKLIEGLLLISWWAR